MCLFNTAFRLFVWKEWGLSIQKGIFKQSYNISRFCFRALKNTNFLGASLIRYFLSPKVEQLRDPESAWSVDVRDVPQEPCSQTNCFEVISIIIFIIITQFIIIRSSIIIAFLIINSWIFLNKIECILSLKSQNSKFLRFQSKEKSEPIGAWEPYTRKPNKDTCLTKPREVIYQNTKYSF